MLCCADIPTRSGSYINCVDVRFRLLNGHAFGKPNTLVVHCSPPWASTFDGGDDASVVKEVLSMLRDMYGDSKVDSAKLVFSHVTRWHEG